MHQKLSRKREISRWYSIVKTISQVREHIPRHPQEVEKNQQEYKQVTKSLSIVIFHEYGGSEQLNSKHERELGRDTLHAKYQVGKRLGAILKRRHNSLNSTLGFGNTNTLDKQLSYETLDHTQKTFLINNSQQKLMNKKV